MKYRDKKNNNTVSPMPGWLKSLGLFIVVFFIVTLIGVMPEIGFLRIYFGGKFNQMAFEQTPSSILWEPPVQFPGKFNELAGNYDAVISSDGNTAIFSREFSEGNYDLFTVSRKDGKWGVPKSIRNINTEYNEVNPAISEDSTLLFFSSDRPSGKGGYDIWCSVFTNEGEWSAPYLLGGDINTEYDELFPEISPLNNLFFFTSNRNALEDETLGNVVIGTQKHASNIYRAVKISEKYDLTSDGPPAFGFVEYMAELNSPYNEGKVAVSEDGNIIFLSSDRPGGLGGYDIYISVMKDGKYIAPINFGLPINSQYDEISPSMKMGTFKIVFNSNRNSRSFKDFHIYESKSQQVFSAINTQVILLLILIAFLLVAIFLLLRYLMSNTDLSLLAKCFLLSVILHLILLLILSAWYLKDQFETEYSDSGQLTLSINNLARESILASIKEGIESLPQTSSAEQLISKSENISSAQFNKAASESFQPSETKSGEKASLSPESIASIDVKTEDLTPSKGGGGVTVTTASLNDNLKFTLEQATKRQTSSDNNSLEGDGMSQGSGSEGEGKGLISGNRTISNQLPGAGALQGRSNASLSNLNTESIKGVNSGNLNSSSSQSPGSLNDISSSSSPGSGSSISNGDEPDDYTEGNSLAKSINPGSFGKDRKPTTPLGTIPDFGIQGSKTRGGIVTNPELGYLTDSKGKSPKTIQYSLNYKKDNTDHRVFTKQITVTPNEDVPISIYLTQYALTRRLSLLSVSGVIYSQTAAFSLPVKTEMEERDEYQPTNTGTKKD